MEPARGFEFAAPSGVIIEASIIKIEPRGILYYTHEQEPPFKLSRPLQYFGFFLHRKARGTWTIP